MLSHGAGRALIRARVSTASHLAGSGHPGHGPPTGSGTAFFLDGDSWDADHLTAELTRLAAGFRGCAVRRLFIDEITAVEWERGSARARSRRVARGLGRHHRLAGDGPRRFRAFAGRRGGLLAPATCSRRFRTTSSSGRGRGVGVLGAVGRVAGGSREMIRTGRLPEWTVERSDWIHGECAPRTIASLARRGHGATAPARRHRIGQMVCARGRACQQHRGRGLDRDARPALRRHLWGLGRLEARGGGPKRRSSHLSICWRPRSGRLTPRGPR